MCQNALLLKFTIKKTHILFLTFNIEGYRHREMESTIRIPILDMSACISLRTNTNEDLEILTACQPIYGNFMTRGLEIVFIFTFLMQCFPKIFFCTQSFWRLMIFKQIYLTYKWDPNKYYYSDSGWTWE